MKTSHTQTHGRTISRYSHQRQKQLLIRDMNTLGPARESIVRERIARATGFTLIELLAALVLLAAPVRGDEPAAAGAVESVEKLLLELSEFRLEPLALVVLIGERPA